MSLISADERDTLVEVEAWISNEDDSESYMNTHHAIVTMFKIIKRLEVHIAQGIASSAKPAPTPFVMPPLDHADAHKRALEKLNNMTVEQFKVMKGKW